MFERTDNGVVTFQYYLVLEKKKKSLRYRAPGDVI